MRFELPWRVQIRYQRWLLPLAVALLLAYTADQLLTGERGIVTWRVMKTQVEALRRENAGMEADIARLERETTQLKAIRTADGTAGKLNADFVDELVRRDLGYIKPGEVVILVSATR
jgi:cell division protein FtsB